MTSKLSKKAKFIYDDKHQEVEAIIPIDIFHKMEKLYEMVDDSEETEGFKLPKPLAWAETGFDEIREKLQHLPNLDFDKAIRMDRDGE